MTKTMFNIIICGRREVDFYRDEVDAIISIMTPTRLHKTPNSVKLLQQKNPDRVLQLQFDDTCSELYNFGEIMVSRENIEQVINFAKYHIQQKPQTNFLVHCHAGISRSTAMALIIYYSFTKDYELAIKKVKEARPQAEPNIEIIRLFDEMLGLKSELFNAVLEKFYGVDDDELSEFY